MQSAPRSNHNDNGSNKVLRFPSGQDEVPRKPPHNLDAEQAVLGAILIANETFDRVVDLLEAHHFYDSLHQQIYETAAKLIAAGKEATPITLKTFFENAEPVDATMTVPQYLGRLGVNATTTANARDYAQTIVDLWKRRQIILIGEDVLNAAYESPVDFPPDEQLSEMRTRVDSLQVDSVATEKSTWVEPDLSLVEDRRGDLPEFPIEVLGPLWREWLMRAALGAGVTPAHVVVPLLSIASSFIGAARQVRPAPAWPQPCALWTAVIGLSGSGKTPGLWVTTRALSAIHRSWKGMLEERRRAHEDKAAASKAAFKKWQSAVTKAQETGAEAPPKPRDAEDPGQFVEPRLYVQDATTERIAVLMQERPAGMALIRDELAGLFNNMGRYSKGSDREFWLEAWNGGQYRVDRQGRAPVDIDHLLVGITGGFQPDKLVKSFAGDDDGMSARFLFAWPSQPKFQPLSDSVVEIEPEFQDALTRLIDLPAGEGGTLEPRYIPLSAEARTKFNRFRQDVEARIVSLDGREREWWCKGPSNVLRLAGTLVYLDWAMRGSRSPQRSADPFKRILADANEPACVSLEYIERAVRLWTEYFWPHARAALRQGGLTDRHRDARSVLRWLIAHGKEETSVEDLRREALSQRLDERQTLALIDKLTKSGWLRAQPVKKQRGKPRRRWEVNPRLAQIAQIAD